MSAGQAALTVLLGNVIVLVPLLLIGHAGARYGIPYAGAGARLVRHDGARLPALARALVACGWYGIQTWIGGEALSDPARISWSAPTLKGATFAFARHRPRANCSRFLAFWAMQLFFVAQGPADHPPPRNLDGAGSRS